MIRPTAAVDAGRVRARRDHPPAYCAPVHRGIGNRLLINWKSVIRIVGRRASRRESEHVGVWGQIMLLGEMVVARGIATVEQVMTALERQRRSGGHLGAHLIALGVLTELELSALLVEQNDARTMLPVCQQSLARWETEFGLNHPTTALARSNLAHTLLADGQAEEALAESQLAVNALRASCGDDHAWTKRAEAVRKTAHYLVYGPKGAVLGRLRAMTNQPAPQNAEPSSATSRGDAGSVAMGRSSQAPKRRSSKAPRSNKPHAQLGEVAAAPGVGVDCLG